MEGQIISVQCLQYDPRQVLILISGPDGIVYGFPIPEYQYKILAMLPGFPPDPCEGT